MGDLKPFHSRLEDLPSKANNLTETGLALDALFAREETRLKREDEASSLRAVYRTIVEQLQQLREIEASASRGHGEAKLMLSLVELAVTAIVSKGRLSAITDCLLQGPTDKQQPLGLVMVCIGPRGLPDDVRGISVSQLARESRRPQSEIMSKLRENDYLLFSEDAFSLLIDGLVGDVRAGKLRLPVSKEKLLEITELNKPQHRVKVIEVE